MLRYLQTMELFGRGDVDAIDRLHKKQPLTILESQLYRPITVLPSVA